MNIRVVPPLATHYSGSPNAVAIHQKYFSNIYIEPTSSCMHQSQDSLALDEQVKSIKRGRHALTQESGYKGNGWTSYNEENNTNCLNISELFQR